MSNDFLTPKEKKAADTMYKDFWTALQALPPNGPDFDQRKVCFMVIGNTAAVMLEGFAPENRIAGMESFFAATKWWVEKGLRNGEGGPHQ